VATAGCIIWQCPTWRKAWPNRKINHQPASRPLANQTGDHCRRLQRIGAALAVAWPAEGYTLALLAAAPTCWRLFVRKFNSSAGEIRAIFYVHDVTNYNSIPGLLQEIIAALGAWT